MAVIIISRGSYSKGKEVAEKLAQRLGYRCMGREVILDASKEFSIPELKLVRAIHDAPSILDRFTFGKERYIIYFQTALLKYLQRDNAVYHGFAGHFFVKDVSHAIKVRIIADMADRVRWEMERGGISREEAQKTLKKDDEERRKWSLNLYGIDTLDPSLYDLVMRIRKMTVEDAVELICHATSLETFKTTFESQRAIDDLVLAAEVKAALIHLKPDIQVFAEDGRVQLSSTALVSGGAYSFEKPEVIQEIRRIALKISKVKSVDINLSDLNEWTD